MTGPKPDGDDGAAGGPPQVDLLAVLHPHAGTRLARRQVRWPWALTNAFYLDGDPPGMATVILQSASGAVIAGDRLRQRIGVGPGASLHVATASATAVHGMPEGLRAEERVELACAAGALLEHGPEPRVMFADAELEARTAISIEAGGAAILLDGTLAHDPEGRGRPFRRLLSELRIRGSGGGGGGAIDRFEVEGEAFAGPFAAHGTVTLLCPGEPARVTGAAAALAGLALTAPDLQAAATALPGGLGLSLRVAARDGGALRRLQRAAWARLRRHLTGADPAPRRTGL